MKIAFIFLSIFVALSLQYNRQRGGIRFPWLPFIHPAYNQYLENNRYYYGDDSPVGRFNPKGPIVYLTQQEDDVLRSSQYNDDFLGGANDGFEDNDARFKSSSSGLSNQPFSPQSQQNARFFFNQMNNNNAFNNPFIRTATFTVTSTATALTVVKCLPSPEYLANDAPCRRRREFKNELMNDATLDSQFVVNPTEVQLVTPTEEPTLTRDARQDWASLDISSSKDETVSKSMMDQSFGNKLLRDGRFLFQNFVTGTTVTTWLITSSNLTQTLMPTNPAVAGEPAPFPCLPPGLVVCA